MRLDPRRWSLTMIGRRPGQGREKRLILGISRDWPGQPRISGDFGPDNPADIFLRKDVRRRGLSGGRSYPHGAALGGSLVDEFLEPLVCDIPVGVESGGNAHGDGGEANADAKEASDEGNELVGGHDARAAIRWLTVRENRIRISRPPSP